MTKADEHPDFAHERRRLARTLTAIEEEHGRAEQTRASGPVYRNADLESRRIDRQDASNMRQAAQEPYFARVDFLHEGSNAPRQVYIGKFGVASSDPSAVVFDWQAPIAGLYYRRQHPEASYTAPGGQIRGILSLLRNYTICQDVLDEILDSWVAPPESSTPLPPLAVNDLEPVTPLDAFLHDVLSHPRDMKLPDIVATIQPEQYDLIATPPDTVLIVQGVAGSGKTSVALHRLAFLLSPHQNVNRLAAERILVLGPNALFLHSIEGVLPGLGVQGIQQITFEGWAREWLGDALRYDPSDLPIEHLLDQSFERRLGVPEHHLLRVATTHLNQLKGSLPMVALLEAHLIGLKQRIQAQATSVQVEYELPHETGMQSLAYATTVRRVALALSEHEVRDAVARTCAEHESVGLQLNVYQRRRRIDPGWRRELTHPASPFLFVVSHHTKGAVRCYGVGK